jgi:surface carbohydrate biosynthesis protein
MTAYLVSLLEIIKPKIVITNIHNSLKFFDVAKILEDKMIFIAIQNGAQYEIKKYKHLYKIKKTNDSDLSKNIFIPHFFCYGQFEVDQHTQENIQVKNFYKVGSLNMANFFLSHK